MDKLCSYVSSLLRDYGYAVVPGVGGFVANECPPRVDHFTGKVAVPVVEVTFNKDMTVNDGLLMQKYMTEAHLSYAAAKKVVERDAARLMQRLDAGEQIVIDGVGTLSKDLRGERRFTAAPPAASLAVWGLGEVAMPLLADLKKRAAAEEKAAHRQETLAMRKKTLWNYVQYAAACIAAIIVYLSFSEPIDNYGLNRYDNYASIVPANVIMAATEQPAAVEVIAETPAPATPAVLPEQSQVKEVPAPAPAEVRSVEGSYCIIVASLAKGTDASSTIEMFVKQGFTKTFAIEGAGRTRISVAAFDTMDEAVDALREIAATASCKDAWILKR